MSDLAVVRDDRPSPLQGEHEHQSASGRGSQPRSLLLAGGFVALTIFVGFALARHSGVPANTVLHSAAHRTGLALTHAPKGIGTLPLVLLQFVGMALTGRVLVRWCRVPVETFAETAIVSTAVGIVAFIPWALLLGATAGLRMPAAVFTLVGYDALGVAAAASSVPRRVTQVRSYIAGAAQRRWPSRPTAATTLLILVVAAALYQVLLGALMPEVAYDPKWYHLGVPAHWVIAGHMTNSVADNSIAISGGPFYQEILYTPFLAVFGQIGAKLVNFGQLLLLCATTFLIARRITGSRNLALSALALLMALPMVTWEGTSAENDLGVACLVAVAFFAFCRWTDNPVQPGWLRAGFICAAGAAGMKYFGFATIFFLIIASLAVYLRQARTPPQRGRAAVFALLRAYAVPALLVAAIGLPGLIRSAVMTGDPVFPALHHIFPTDYWNDNNSAALNTLPGNYFPRALVDIFRVPWEELIARSHGRMGHAKQWGPFLVLFLPVLAGACLFRRNRRGDLGFLWLAVGVSLLWWYPLVRPLSTRYLIPIGSLLCVALVAVLQRAAQSVQWRPLVWCAVPVAALTVLVGQPFLNGVLPGMQDPYNTQGGVYYDDDYLFGSATVDDVQVRWLPSVQYVNSHLPSTARIWDVDALLAAYLYVKPQVFSGWYYDSPREAGQWDICSQDAAYWLRKRHVGYVVVPEMLRRDFAGSQLLGRSTKLYSDPTLTLYRVNTSGATGPLPIKQRVLCLGGHATSD